MKQFLEAFQNVEFNDALKKIFSDVYVIRIALSKDRRSLKIYISSDHLIEKRLIWAAEGKIKESIFPGKDCSVAIKENFRLSRQYTAKSLYSLYKDSILSELKREDIILYKILKEGRESWIDDDTLQISIPEIRLYEGKTAELKHILQRIFSDRCSVGIELSFDTDPVKKESVTGDLKTRASNKDALENDFSDEKVMETGSLTKAPLERTNDTESDINSDEEGKENSENTVNPEEKYKREFKGKIKSSLRTFSRQYKFKTSEDTLYGKYFEGEAVPITDINESSGNVIIEGELFHLYDPVKLRTGKYIYKFDITDFLDSLTVKIFVEEDDLNTAQSLFKEGTFLKIKGNVSYDSFDRQLELSYIDGILKGEEKREKRLDTSLTKRTELHLHTKMSDMDGVSDVCDYIKKAITFGMNSMAITDHGVVQAFPDAYEYLKKTGNKDFKLIYGCEGYLVDDLGKIVENQQGQDIFSETVVFDIETTGFNEVSDRIIEIAGVKIRKGVICERFQSFVNPKIPIPYRITVLTGISDNDVINAPPIEEVLKNFMDFTGNDILVAHNADFDTGFLAENLKRSGKSLDNTIIDTLKLSRLLIPGISKYRLENIAHELKITLNSHHRAINDAECLSEIYLKELSILQERKVQNVSQIDSLEFDNSGNILKMPMYHIILLAKNDTGRINLYTLISESHIKYFRKRPRIPRSLLNKYREGLIVGSACVQGELFQKMLEGNSEERLLETASFYDYLEVQPIGNNSFLKDSEKYPDIKTDEDLIDLNLRIISLADQLKKPCVATCDAHYINKEDDIYRRIITYGIGMEGESSELLYFRTTDEMLEEFSYLDREKAEEIVVRNTNLISRMCDPISPVRPDKCPPVIEHSDEILRNLCYETARKIYGPVLPEPVSERLEKELNSIISNGYSVMYIIAQRLVDKSLEDGYLVGSRGSVGSSFVATMAHITEVNPLSPHYVCPKCFWNDFSSEEVKKYSGMAGCDMPDRTCPVCGERLKRYGFDIPFETFLGFNGDKEPDIDLNFSGEYQAKAHAYTGVIFGEGHTFKAGTIGTVADKKAYGMVKKYFEDRGIQKRNAEINRLIKGLMGVRNLTGQHPGGIVVLPHGENINSFTPVQHPANRMDTKIITTHFDYHKIDHNLLKLDILGHDDPTMIRRLEDLIGINAVTDIPLDCPEVMSLFQGTEILGIRPEDIHGVRLGCLGVPEFGTGFAMQMVEDTKPKYFSDLIRISGLSHGTDVYLNNAQDLIKQGIATLQNCICCRDDIMVYLMSMGLDPGLSFKIMESTRKGKGISPEWEKEMLRYGVPEWYISSCNKIKYMFPKAHAAAYVMMAWRVAWCKVFYPIEYYCAYFSIRADGFSYDLCCNGKENLKRNIDRYINIENPSHTEELVLRDMRICEEMYARNIEFAPIDIFKARAKDFTITEDRRIMPSFTSIPGLGETAAQGIEEGAKHGKFLSKDDFIMKTHCPQGFADKFHEMGLLGDIPESNQLSIFDLNLE